MSPAMILMRRHYQNGYSIEIIQIKPLLARVLILWVTPVGGQEFVIRISHVLRMFS